MCLSDVIENVCGWMTPAEGTSVFISYEARHVELSCKASPACALHSCSRSRRSFLKSLRWVASVEGYSHRARGRLRSRQWPTSMAPVADSHRARGRSGSGSSHWPNQIGCASGVPSDAGRKKVFESLYSLLYWDSCEIITSCSAASCTVLSSSATRRAALSFLAKLHLHAP